ncbi:MAG: murein biosynthesis integral membrane protein MurJ [Bacillota bacterium]
MFGRTIFQATLLIVFFNLLSRLLGLVREMVIAHQFGVSVATDAYLVAFTLPNVLFTILTGALATVVVPVFNEYAVRGEREEAWRIFSSVFNLVLAALLGVTVVGIGLAPWLVKILAPKLASAALALAADLARVMFPVLVFSGLATLFTGLLNANNIFGITAFSGSVNNLVIIAATLTLGGILGIHGLAWGTTAGMAAAALVQLPALYWAGFRYRPGFDWRHPGVRKVFYLVLPVAVAISINQIYIIIDRFLASGLPEGSIAALNFSNKLIQLPVNLFVLALGTAVFPSLTRWVAEGRHRETLDALQRALRLVFLVAVPSAVGLIVLRYPIVRLLFERGAFDARATEMTAAAVLFYSVGLAAFAANVILTRGFYAFQDTRTPVRLTLVAVLANLILSLILMRPLLHGGLALANSFAGIINMLLLSRYLVKKLPGLWDASWLRFALDVAAASTAMALAAVAADAALAPRLAALGEPGLALEVGGAILAGGAVYLLACLVLRVEETGLLTRRVARVLAGIRAVLPGRGR